MSLPTSKAAVQPTTKLNDGDCLKAVETRQAGESNALDFKIYKRRYFVLATIAFINITLPWAWLSYAVVTPVAQEAFNVDATAINWFSSVYGLTFAPFLFSGWLINKYGVRASLIAGSSLMLAGSWLRYGGTIHGSYGISMAGQTLLGLSQIFVLGLGPVISDLWFGPAHRTLPTALGSVAPSLGSLVGSLAPPYIATSVHGLHTSILIVSVATTVGAIAGLFVPAKPPSPVCYISEERSTITTKQQVLMLLKMPEVYMIAVAFIMGLALFNVWASLLFLYLAPYGFPVEDAGLLIGLQTGLGVFFAILIAPVVDRWRLHIPTLKILFSLGGLFNLIFIWVPSTGSRGFAFAMSILMGVVGTAALAIALESLAEISYPVAPEFTSVPCWSMGNFLGGVLLFGFAEGYDPYGKPPYNYNKALYAQGAVAVLFLIVPVNMLGLFGRKDKIRFKRREQELARAEASSGEAMADGK